MKYLIILLLIITSCSSKYHLKKAFAKDPSLLKMKSLEVQYDTTIFINDTIYIPQLKVGFNKKNYIYEDSIIKIIKKRDSVVVIRKPMYIPYNDTIHITDTIIVPYKQFEVQKDIQINIKTLIFVLILILIIMIILFLKYGNFKRNSR